LANKEKLKRSNDFHCYIFYALQFNTNERDGGVLVGNWSGKYDDGVAPHAWNGSAAILEEFLKKRKGVKYGQCWTFAAVATTGTYCYVFYYSYLRNHNCQLQETGFGLLSHFLLSVQYNLLNWSKIN
jgi:hypothetical protein